MIIRIYFDGGTSMNHICVYDSCIDKYIHETLLEPLTNNQLEYHALLKAVQYANEKYGDANNIVFCGDSEVIIRHMQGDYKVRKPHLKYLYDLVVKEFTRHGVVVSASKFEWVPRDENPAGVYLENLAK